MQKYHVKLIFTEPILGTVPKDPEVYKTYIAGQSALTDEAVAEELATVEKIEEKGWTGFHKLDGQPVLYDYAIKGFLKDACSMLKRDGETRSAKLTAFKKIIDGMVFIEPRQIPLNVNGSGMGTLERPLRAQTAQGERVTLARSDTCPAGTTMEFDVIVLGGVSEKLLQEWFSYGKWRGLGQWRSASYGRFEHTITEVIP
jgi:hypothetical protein